ncbi:uncharacterized protein LOC108675891 [Hyalella azteca]|uniref:XK-related protein n=1 Tax=Hyalella azteca TaxID=294128 RepID=A0A8B7P325_HYAAZ|nr:uncharacterized protein LOC108675891 [Hyalella azteca]
MSPRTVSFGCILNLLRGDGVFQFTWMEMLFIPLMLFSYTFGYAVSVVIVVQKEIVETPTDHRHLYAVLLVLGHLTAGIVNVNFHLQDVRRGSSTPQLLLHCCLWPVSPLIRYARATRFGLREKKDPAQGIRFLDESAKAGLLRLCDSLVCDLPFLVLLMWDDLWAQPLDWVSMVGGDPSLPPPPPMMRWKIFRFLFLLSKVAQTVAFCSVILKRQYHHRHAERYKHVASAVARQGRLNFFATLLLFASQLTFTASRVLGYSMAVTGCGAWLLAIVAVRWLAHALWHSASVKPPKTTSLTSSLMLGAVWLLGLTNPFGEAQFRRFLLYATLASAESVVCVIIWAQSPVYPPFHDNAPFVLLGTFLLWLAFHCTRYAFCHASQPKAPSYRQLSCCSKTPEGITDALQVQFSGTQECAAQTQDPEETVQLCNDSSCRIDSDDLEDIDDRSDEHDDACQNNCKY